ncbi:hypothetical protein EDS67_21005 [candidate division KSB1 bacterium]|nr:MAG: hypothetical protein EDS67_21005 [candidate division KSB1 bacterium]MBC6948253.1 hypothetical protein [candidate division KSB1 bacterium]MCE7943513.1 hypothetical protein [Chlorobi bacterium CHB1]MDL1877821.1 hypothetical protein [Cytophagia bacterium CHB2]
MSIFSKRLAVLFLLAASAAANSQIEKPALRVPHANAAIIDGKLREEEWKSALKQTLVGGGELHLQHDGEFLYIGIESGKPGWAHV